MKNTNALFRHPKYQKYLKKIRRHEKGRVFCKHNLSHFLDVGRICYILCLEENFPAPKDMIYATALLHDIGRFKQYEGKEHHTVAGEKLARRLLEVTDFTEEEKQTVLEAIRHHGHPSDSGFPQLFYRADKLSRRCFACPGESRCHWKAKNKNQEIHY